MRQIKSWRGTKYVWVIIAEETVRNKIIIRTMIVARYVE